MKIAMLYALGKPHCTGAGMHRAFEKLGHEVTAYDSVYLDWMKDTKIGANFDLYFEATSSGRFNKIPLPESDGVKAYWAIDTVSRYKDELSVAKNYDLIFTPNTEHVRALREDLPKKEVQLLLLGADDSYLYDRQLPRTLEVAFVGGQSFPGRRLFLKFVHRHFAKRGFVGKAYMDELAKIYSSAKIGVNYAMHGKMNLRVFEVMACGALLLTNYSPEAHELGVFEAGEHYVEYKKLGELKERAQYYLRHAAERERIAKAGQRRVMEKHTLTERAKEVLRAVKKA